MILAAAMLLFGFVLVAAIWFAVSNLSTGYEVSHDEVKFRIFDNLNWKVTRSEVAGADPSSFSTVDGCGGHYGYDQHKVYFETTWLSHADPATFHVLDWREHYSRDANHAYWKSILVTDDVANFQVLSRGYSKDSQHVYYGRQVVEKADPATFVVTGTVTSEANDRNQTYDMGRVKQ